jgi:hypothetical protein
VADFAGMRMPGQIFFGQPHELKLFGAIDGLESLAGSQALARFDFDERERFTPAYDQINLAGAKTNVATDDGVTAQTIEPRGAAFPERAQLADVETAFE